MSKRSVKKAKKKAELKKANTEVKVISRKKLIWKRVGLGVFFTLGSIIIILAGFVVFALFSGNDINNLKPVNNVKDFIYLYEQNEFERDLPENLIITEKSLTIDEANHTYKITLAVKSRSQYEKPLYLQLFYSPEYESFKKGVKNPLLKIGENDAMLLKDDIERFSVTGTFEKGTDTDTLIKYLNSVYMEVILGNDVGRVLLPLDIYIE